MLVEKLLQVLGNPPSRQFLLDKAKDGKGKPKNILAKKRLTAFCEELEQKFKK